MKRSVNFLESKAGVMGMYGASDLINCDVGERDKKTCILIHLVPVMLPPLTLYKPGEFSQLFILIIVIEVCSVTQSFLRLVLFW
jgi:hypothetical protein